MPEIELLVRYSLFILTFLFILFPNCYSQEFPINSVDSLLKIGINNLLNQNYDEAEDIFLQLDKDYPSLPFGKIYLAALEITKAYDYANEFNSELIENNFDEAEKITNDLIKKDKNNVWNIYFKSLISGYKAYYEALRENWLLAISDGYNSIKSFDELLQLDPTFYDGYIAIGTYKYWKSKKTKDLNWLPFFDDESKSGIDFLLKAKNNFSYNNFLAIYSLQWIYINQKEFSEAINISNNVLKEYPNSRFFKWGLARAYEEVNKNKAIKIYFDILNSYKNLKKLNGYNEIVLKHLIAQQYEELGNYNEALKLCDEILNKKNISKNIYDKLGNRIERVKNLKVKLEKILLSKN